MGVNSLPSAWRTSLRTGAVPNRDLRMYLDPRGVEYPDLGTGTAGYTLARDDNLIDRGNCESATAPMMLGETVPVTTNCTWARSADFAHGGDYSFKCTRTAAAGNFSLAYLTDSASTTDMHDMVAGETQEVSYWAYIPTASGLDVSEMYLVIRNYRASTAAWSTVSTVAVATSLDTWTELTDSVTLNDDATGYVAYFVTLDTAANAEYFYVDDVRFSRHSVPGSHYLSSGYIETLCPMTETFTLQIKFKPNFAYNTGSNQNLLTWVVSSTQRFYITYQATNGQFIVGWRDGGTERYLLSAQYDDGSAERNINQWITLTLAFDSTGGALGSLLYLDKTLDDNSWGAAPDAKTTEFNKMQVRAYTGTTGDYDIAYVRLFPNLVATDAQVQNDFKDVANEEIFWSLDGHGTGKTRCNITPFLSRYDIYKGVTGKISESHGTNLLNFTLKNLQGEFSDDQYATFTPTSYQYNGTSAQAYLTRRNRVSLESWYGGDFEHLFVGRLTEQGLVRQSFNNNVSYVSGTAEDGVGDLDRTFERFGDAYEDFDIVGTTVANSLFHAIAHRADRSNIQFLANNSFENTTIGNSWLVTAGGTLTKDATTAFFGSNCGKLVPGAAAEQLYQTVTFIGERKLNVGETYTFWCWLYSAGAASGANNFVKLVEYDDAVLKDSTSGTYTLAGGEGFKLASVTHTITSSDSDRLRVEVGGEAADAGISVDGCMLVPTDEALYYFDENTNDGASGVESADDAASISWPWFGIDANPVDYLHPWRRVEQGSSVWENVKSLANASGPIYCGMSECNTLTLKAFLQTDYSDDVPIDEWTTARQNIGVGLDAKVANSIKGHGVKIVKADKSRLLWIASSTGNFNDTDGDNVLEEVVANGGVWPNSDDYPEYWAQYSGSGNYFVGTIFPIDRGTPPPHGRVF